MIRHSGCQAQCVIDELERACISPDPNHDGPHKDADGIWLVDGRPQVVDAAYRYRWLGEWWA